jgi:hypothetical protein
LPRLPVDLVTDLVVSAICDRLSPVSAAPDNPIRVDTRAFTMELAGLEPATSWVRCIARAE